VAINPGRMRLLIRLEQRTTAKNTAGEPKNEWILVKEVRAEVVRSTGKEIFAAQERQGRVPTLFKLRWRDGIVPQMRIRWGSKLFNILSAIDPDGMRAELLVTTEELVGRTSP